MLYTITAPAVASGPLLAQDDTGSVQIKQLKAPMFSAQVDQSTDDTLDIQAGAAVVNLWLSEDTCVTVTGPGGNVIYKRMRNSRDSWALCSFSLTKGQYTLKGSPILPTQKAE